MWKESGPLKVWLPSPQQMSSEARPVRVSLVISSCSRSEWMEFVERVKAGDFDVPDTEEGRADA